MTTLEPLKSTLVDEFDDDLDTIMALVTQFVEHTLPAAQQEVRRCLKENSMENLLAILHSVKGTAGGFGYLPMSNLLAEIEESIRHHNYRVMRDQLGQFDILCERIYLGHRLYHSTHYQL